MGLKAAGPLMMSWTALHPTCGNHRGLSGKESQDGDHYDDRVGYREVGVSGARDRCGRRRGGASAPEPGAWTANSVLKLKARLPNRGPADHPSEGPSE